MCQSFDLPICTRSGAGSGEWTLRCHFGGEWRDCFMLHPTSYILSIEKSDGLTALCGMHQWFAKGWRLIFNGSADLYLISKFWYHLDSLSLPALDDDSITNSNITTSQVPWPQSRRISRIPARNPYILKGWRPERPTKTHQNGGSQFLRRPALVFPCASFTRYCKAQRALSFCISSLQREFWVLLAGWALSSPFCFLLLGCLLRGFSPML